MWTTTEIVEFSDLMAALRNYRESCSLHIDKLISTGLRTPEEIDSLRAAVASNSDLFEYMAHLAPEAFGQPPDLEFPVTRPASTFDSTDLHQLTSALRCACRDWTSLGDAERAQTYGPVVSCIAEFLPPGSTVCVPGSGLGRLAVEIASRGFIAHANENAFVMIVLSRIALLQDREFRVFPWCHMLSGLDAFADSLVSAAFPEARIRDADDTGIVPPVELLSGEQLVLLAGGFAGLRQTSPEAYDAVATCFFIDVVDNLAETIEVIHGILKPGGYWVNFGPMMLHHEDEAFFTTATLDDVTAIARRVGFQIVKEDRVETTYIAHPTSHIRTIYRCKLSVARK
jgi:carnosine N-methyltransferase